MTTTTKEALEPCPLNHRVSAGLRVNKTDPRIHCLDCGLSIAATDWFTLYERWNSRPSAPVVGSVAVGQSNIVFIDREAAASRAETAWTLTTHLGRPDESAMYQYACEVAARLIREMKPVPATVCRDERETFKEAIKWAKKVQAVKLDAARNAASDDEFAAMRLLSEANGAERVVETLEAALEASVSTPIVAPEVDELSQVLGYLHVINAEANLLVNFTDDPHLRPKERGEKIQEYRLKAHHAICKAMDTLRAAPASPAALRDEADTTNLVFATADEFLDAYNAAATANLLNEIEKTARQLLRPNRTATDIEFAVDYIVSRTVALRRSLPPATTPPSTLAHKAAEEIVSAFPEIKEHDKWVTLGRVKIDRETETETFERASAPQLPVKDQIAAIIERCLAGGGEGVKPDQSQSS